MKFLTTIVAALAFITTPALAAYPDYATPCGKKNPAVVAAIGRFCTKLGDNNRLPNSVAANGMNNEFKGKNAWVAISGNSCGKQWVPKEWCFRQFYQVCANGDKKGHGSGMFGKNRCQKFLILKGKHQ